MSSSSTETLVDVTMPQMGVSVAEGTVVEWKKQLGDWVEADEIIASISTDKIDTDVESPATGRIAEVLVEVGTTVDVGTVLARIATDARPGEAHVSEADSPDAGDANSKLLAAEVKSVQFQYFDGSEWEDSWDGTQAGSDGVTPIGPPLAIAVTLGIAGPDGEVKTYRHVVAIPTANNPTPSQLSASGTTSGSSGP